MNGAITEGNGKVHCLPGKSKGRSIGVEERKSYRQVKLGREEGKKFYGASG